MEVIFEYEIYHKDSGLCINVKLSSGEIIPKRNIICGESFENCYKKLARWIHTKENWFNYRFVIKNYNIINPINFPLPIRCK